MPVHRHQKLKGPDLGNRTSQFFLVYGSSLQVRVTPVSNLKAPDRFLWSILVEGRKGQKVAIKAATGARGPLAGHGKRAQNFEIVFAKIEDVKVMTHA